MKIAIEARPLKWSYGTGIGNYTYGMIEQLNEIDQQNEYTFLWPDQNPNPYIPFTREYSFYSLPKDDEREAIEMPLWLEKEGADLFHLPQNGFRIPRTKSTKLIVTIHDLIPYFMPEIVRPSFLKRFMREMPEIVEKSDHILTVSELSKQDLISIFKVNPMQITVVPSAPASDCYPLPKGETRFQLIKKYRLKNPYILYAGGLNPRKNIIELIFAYSKVYRDLPGRQQLVVLGGEGKHLLQLKKLVESLHLQQDVIFPGFVKSEDLPLFYNGAELFVYPSLYEGFGLPPVEAMVCGTPVITSNVSSLPEVVGDAAIQINPYDTLGLAQAIHLVLTNQELREKLIQKGLLRSQQYTWKQNSTRILAVYRAVVTGTPVSTVAGQ